MELGYTLVHETMMLTTGARDLGVGYFDTGPSSKIDRPTSCETGSDAVGNQHAKVTYSFEYGDAESRGRGKQVRGEYLRFVMGQLTELYAAVRALWADAELLFPAPGVLAGLMLSPGTNATLRQIGMPREMGGGVMFGAREPMLLESSTGSRYLRLGVGAHGQCDICIELATERVVCPFTNGEDSGPVGFYVNRDVTTFLDYLQSMETYFRVLEDGDEDLIVSERDRVRAHLRSIDELALGPTAWWTGYVEEMDMV
ncbi:hypothetical protein GCM10009682_10330 [Luedemannella flava]|uniref:SUKH-4 immunity protein of toxin-antitoxin system n=1 Tax=Luedemannella flava TaxID=349316 RepID=A0ABP4XSV0_9ACTN